MPAVHSPWNKGGYGRHKNLPLSISKRLMVMGGFLISSGYNFQISKIFNITFRAAYRCYLSQMWRSQACWQGHCNLLTNPHGTYRSSYLTYGLQEYVPVLLLYCNLDTKDWEVCLDWLSNCNVACGCVCKVLEAKSRADCIWT